MSIPVEKFGKDHWSVLAYIETVCAEFKGVPDRDRMRCDVDVHPQFKNRANFLGGKFPTKLNDGTEIEGHDDWSCSDDLEAAGFIENLGTGVNPMFKMTELGREVVASIRKHKSEGGAFNKFRWDAA